MGSFSSLHKSTTCKVKDKVVSLISGKKLFARTAIIDQKRSVNMRSLFNYPLGSLPLALAEMDGTLKKTHKSVLGCKHERTGQTVEALPTDYILIIDGVTGFRQFQIADLTYKKFAGQLLRYFISLERMRQKSTQYLMSIIRIRPKMLNGIYGVQENYHSTEFCQIWKSNNGTCSFHLTPIITN